MSVNLRFSFKMDLADISTIDFAFAETYADLETNPFLEKSYPEVGTLQNKAIVIPLSDEEAEELPTQFYALSTVNFKNGSTVKAHAFKNTAKESALSAILMTDNTEYNIDFFIDETNGGGGGVDAYINGVKLEGYKTAAELDLVKASEDIKIWEAVLDDNNNISNNPEDYPGIKKEDLAIYASTGSQLQMWNQVFEPTEDFIYWTEVGINNENKHFEKAENPPTEIQYSELQHYKVGDLYLNTTSKQWYLLTGKNINVLTWTPLAKEMENPTHIYPAILNDDGSLNRIIQDNYTGIKEKDLIIDKTSLHNLQQSPRIWEVVSIRGTGTNAYIASVRYMGCNSLIYDTNSLPTSLTPTVGIQIPEQGEIYQTRDNKYYQCMDIIDDGGRPATYTITWQEVTFIPKPTAADAGKVLKVNASGEPEWVAE